MPLDLNAPFAFQPDRAAALERLTRFLPNAGRQYASSRNADLGPDDRSNVSVLSPYVRHRLILETEVLDAVLGRFALSTSEKFVQEVFWRTYFKGWLEQRPSVWHSYRDDTARLIAALNDNAGLATGYREAVEGRTGIACFDAWARELVETGYLHNHTRMWFASIWIFTLKLPWQLGADFFLRHLMDGDPASNTLSWRWVAGLHTKGKTYLARPDNIAKYTGGRFHPGGQLATEALPLSEDATHGRKPLPQAMDRAPDAPVLLLITEDDGHPESLFAGTDVKSALAISSCDARSELPVGAAAKTFSDGARRDTVQRTEAAFQVKVAEADADGNLPERLIEAARSANVTTIATPYVPVGPSATALADAMPKLEVDGIRLVQVRRTYDELAWPHATKGFFALKTKIPDILKDLARTAEPRLL
jgi:deoxyribodipyrimidine photo-lyase